MAYTVDKLIQQINQFITNNSSGEITGPILNDLLKKMVGGLSESFYKFPKDPSLTSSDISKVVMNDGSGTAKLYQFSPAKNAQPSRWILGAGNVINDDLSTSITFENETYGEVTICAHEWRIIDPVIRNALNNGETIDIDASQELQLLKNHINSSTDSQILSNFTAIDHDESDKLIIQENNFYYSEISINNWSNSDLFIDVLGHPALPPAPSALALGRLVGIEDEFALISQNYIETYTLDGAININHNFFDANFNISGGDQSLTDLLNMIIIPSENANARVFRIEDLVFDDIEPSFGSMRHSILGLALNATETNVTVLSLPILTNFIQVLLKTLYRTGQIGDNSSKINLYDLSHADQLRENDLLAVMNKGELRNISLRDLKDYLCGLDCPDNGGENPLPLDVNFLHCASYNSYDSGEIESITKAVWTLNNITDDISDRITFSAVQWLHPSGEWQTIGANFINFLTILDPQNPSQGQVRYNINLLEDGLSGFGVTTNPGNTLRVLWIDSGSSYTTNNFSIPCLFATGSGSGSGSGSGGDASNELLTVSGGGGWIALERDIIDESNFRWVGSSLNNIDIDGAASLTDIDGDFDLTQTGPGQYSLTLGEDGATAFTGTLNVTELSISFETSESPANDNAGSFTSFSGTIGLEPA